MKAKVFCLFVTMLISGFSLTGQTAEPAVSQAVTSADPDIPLDELGLLLKPLTRDELKVEVEAWLKLLQGKATEIGTAEIAVKRRKAELAKAEDIKDALSEVEQAKKSLDKAASEGEEAAVKAEQKLREAEKEVEQATQEALQTVERTANDQSTSDIEAIAAQKSEEKKRKELAESDGEITPSEGGEEALPEDPNQQKLQQAVKKREQARTEVLDYLTELRAQQTVLIDRTNLAIDAYEAKGGVPEDIEMYRQ